MSVPILQPIKKKPERIIVTSNSLQLFGLGLYVYSAETPEAVLDILHCFLTHHELELLACLK